VVELTDGSARDSSLTSTANVEPMAAAKTLVLKVETLCYSCYHTQTV